MPRSVARLLAETRGAVVRRAALFAVVTLVAVWIADAGVDAALTPRTFRDELLRPEAIEVWIRAFFTALAVAVYLLHRSRVRLRLFSAALAEAPDGIQIADLDGRIAYSNAAVREIYGFSPAELVGKHVSDMNVDPSFATRVVLPMLEQHGRWVGEIEVKHKDGHTFPIWLTAAVVRDPRGKPTAAIGVIRDIAERKRAEEALWRYARELEETTELKELFADILRHDLLAPASSLRLAIDGLKRRPVDAPTAKLLDTSSRACESLTEMIEGAARYAKLSAPQEIQLSRIDLGAVLRTVVADFELPRLERGAQVAFEPQGEYPVLASPMISEVFANLLSNAIKYGPRGGTIGIDVQDLGDHWRVSVSDEGSGIADADKPKVFTRFERLRKEGVKGTGIGLAIAKRIVELHGGRIWVEDNPTGGSVFSVVLAKVR